MTSKDTAYDILGVSPVTINPGDAYSSFDRSLSKPPVMSKAENPYASFELVEPFNPAAIEERQSAILRILKQYAHGQFAQEHFASALDAELNGLAPDELRLFIRSLCQIDWSAPRMFADGYDIHPSSTAVNEVLAHLRAYIGYKSETGRIASRPSASSVGDAAVERAAPRDWNEEFQTVCGSFDDDTLLEEESKFQRLATLASDFLCIAKNTGRTIIAEKHWPNEMKTIKPLKQLGVAGGQKYCSQGVFFKFAIDDKGIYGSDEHAAKAAGLELLGLSKAYQCGESKLYLPLMSLIDYRGYRLVAVSTLPIDDSTLIYGSNDGGKTIRDSDPAFAEIMSRLAKKLNLKGHTVQDNSGKPLSIFGPFDMEGHKGNDGRYYCLDFSRLFPPSPATYPASTPTDSSGTLRRPLTWLYRMFRPELVQKNPLPLNCDAFAFTLVAKDPVSVGQSAKDVEEIQQAFLFLKQQVIPSFVTWLESQNLNGPERDRLTAHLHHFGINIRYLGLVRSRVKNPGWRNALLVEMTARTLKHHMRARFRDLMLSLEIQTGDRYNPVKGQKAVMLSPATLFRSAALDFMNLAMGETTASKQLWKELLNDLLESRFVEALSAEEVNIARTVGFKSLFRSSPSYLAPVLLRFCALSGFVLHADIDEFLTKGKDPKQIERFFGQVANPITDEMLVDMGEVIKQMPVVSYAQGSALLVKSYRLARNGLNDMAGLVGKKAMVCFERVLAYAPDDPATLANYSFLYQNIFSDYAQALVLLQRSVEANPFHARSWYYLALHYLYYTKKFKEGEKYILKAIEVSDYKHPNALKEYANYCRYNIKNPAEAIKYYRMAIKAKPTHIKAHYNLSQMLLNDMADDVSAVEEGAELLKRAAFLRLEGVYQGTSPKYMYSKLLRLRAEMLFLLKPSVCAANDPPTDAKMQVPILPLLPSSALPSNYAPYLQEADACFRLSMAFCYSPPQIVAYADFLCTRLDPPLLDKAEYVYLKAIENAARLADRRSAHNDIYKTCLSAYVEFLSDIRKEVWRALEVLNAFSVVFPRDSHPLLALAEHAWKQEGNKERASSLFERAVAADPTNKVPYMAYINFLKSYLNASKEREKESKGQPSPAGDDAAVGGSAPDGGIAPMTSSDIKAKMGELSKIANPLKAHSRPLRRSCCFGKKCRGASGTTGLECTCHQFLKLSRLSTYPFKLSVFHDPELRDILGKIGMGPPPQLPIYAVLSPAFMEAVHKLAYLAEPELLPFSPYGWASEEREEEKNDESSTTVSLDPPVTPVAPVMPGTSIESAPPPLPKFPSSTS